MDNYYFTLDGNAKRYVQYLACHWASLTDQKQTSKVCLALIRQLIDSYPVAVPLLCTTRVAVNGASKRFVEVLVEHISEESLGILKGVLTCRCIRYKNGKDFISEEVTPLVLKAAVQVVNQGSTRVEHLSLLADSVSHSRCGDLKTDLIQKTLETLNYEISRSECEGKAYKLSEASGKVLDKFFEKKEAEMKKQGLRQLAKELAWGEIRRSSPTHKLTRKRNTRRWPSVRPSW